MQSSSSMDRLELGEKKHKPVQHARSHEIQAEKRNENYPTVNRQRSTSSNFKDSIRNFSSCTFLKRKSSRTNRSNLEESSSSSSSRQKQEKQPKFVVRIDRANSIRSEISSSRVDLSPKDFDSFNNENQEKFYHQELRQILSMPEPMIEGSRSNEILSTENSSNIFQARTHPSLVQTKSANEFSWLDEKPSMKSESNEFSSVRLEIDEKPFFYRQRFQSNEHFNWYGISETEGPMIISYKYSLDTNKQRSIVAIFRTRQSTSIEHLNDPSTNVTALEILRRLCEQRSINDVEHFDPIISDGTHELLTKYDESFVSDQHKFGIIYQRENQTSEEEFFSNEIHNSTMERFLNLIGQRIKLKEFRGYRGGLDVKSDFTGTESIYEEFENHQIMFHVSTLLPHSKIERQQLERKRHIGNDIVAIVFQERQTDFYPEWIISQFLHVYLVISPVDEDGKQIRIKTLFRDSVPHFGPTIDHSKSFDFDQTLKSLILTKLINAEIASCQSKTFQKYRDRTRMNLFENLYQTLHENNRPYMNFILFYSQYKHECDIEQQQQKDEIQHASHGKGSERHADSSLLGSMRRRFIPPKSRPQNSGATSSSGTTNNVSSSSANHHNEFKSRPRTMTIDVKHHSSKEQHHMSNNGKTLGLFSSLKSNHGRTEKSKVFDAENNDLSTINTRSTVKYLSATASDGNFNDRPYLHPLSSRFSMLPGDETDDEPRQNLSIDDLRTLTRDDLIKVICNLQQQQQQKTFSLSDDKDSMAKQISEISPDHIQALKNIYGSSL